MTGFCAVMEIKCMIITNINILQGGVKEKKPTTLMITFIYILIQPSIFITPSRNCMILLILILGNDDMFVQLICSSKLHIYIWWSMKIRSDRYQVEIFLVLYNIIDTHMKVNHYFNHTKYIGTQYIFPLSNWYCFVPSGGFDDPDTVMSVTIVGKKEKYFK